MKRFLIIIGLLSLLWTAGLAFELMEVNPLAKSDLTINVLESHEDMTVVEILLNHYLKDSIGIEGTEYLHIRLPSQGVRLERGNPELPVIARSLMIPPQSKMHVEVLESSFTEFTGRIAPSKGSLLRDTNPADVPFEFSEIYHVDAFFPENIVELNDPYIMREMRGIAFRATPFAVNPVQGLVRVYERIVIKVYADGVDTIDILPARSSRITRDFVNLYNNHFINYAHVRSRYTAIEEQGSMLVIAFPAFMEAMQPYVDWKNQKGIPTVMIPSTTAGTTPAQIKSFIENYWTANPSLAFVQLVGDAPQIPTFTQAGGGSDPTYVMIHGSNSYPDLFIGRFSAENVAQVQTQVERTIYYERDIVDGDWLSKGMGVASNEGGPGWGGWQWWSDVTLQNNIRAMLLDYTYDSVDQMYQDTSTTAQISVALDEGRSIINYTGHGSEQSWSSPYFANTHVNALVNDWMLPHIILVACVSGDFVSNFCFAEAWMRATNNTTGAPTGAIAIYASTINQPWDEPMPGQYHAMQLLTSEQKHSIGGLYYNGSSYMLDLYPNTAINTIRTWTVFGDVSLTVRTNQPLAMEVEASDIFFMGLTEYPVTVDTPGALVSLYRPETNELLGSAYADANGEAMIVIAEPFTEPCTLLLTITAYNKITEIREVAVIPNDGPYLVFNSYDFAQGGGAIYGTTPTLNVTVYNVGSEDAENVVATLISNDQYINIIEDKTTVDLIGSNEYFEISDAFVFDVASNIPDQHVALFTLTVGNDSDVWSMNFRVIFDAPVLNLAEAFFVNVASGNDRLNPGETAELHVPFVNIGHADSSIGNIIISSLHPQVTISENITMIPVVKVGDTSYAVFTVSADIEIERGSRVTFGIFAEFSTDIFQSSVAFPVGLMIEDFETGDLSVFDWVNTGLYPWTVTSDDVYQGLYAFSSGAITHSQASLVSITRELSAPGFISFYHKVSSENDSDFLQFYLNGTILSQWSGERDWTYAEFSIPAGTHQFRWVYRKDGSGSAGQDKAWIDYITFPLSGGSEYNGPVFFVNVDSVVFEDAKIGESYTTQFYLINLGNQTLTGNINVPEGFSLYPSAGLQPPNFLVNANNHVRYDLVFKPTELKDYSGNIILTSNDKDFTEYHIKLTADLAVSDADTPALATQLLGNFPNPFNPETTIRFSMAKSQNVEISIYNIRGQLVRNLINEEFSAGVHNVIWNGEDTHGQSVASGIYFYRFSTPEMSSINRMLLMK